MQNLRDKLLKAGLVTQDEAKKVIDAAPQRPPPQAEASPRRDERARPPRSEARPPPRRDDRPARSFARPEARSAPRPAAAAPVERAVPKLPPLPGSKAHQRIESRKQQEQDRQLRELVLGNQVPVEVGATVFYFMTRKGKLRRLELTEPQAKQLETGVLAVVERPEPAQIEHSLVPAEAAEKMFALSQKSVRFLNRPTAPIGFMNDDDVKAQQEKEATSDAEDATAASEPAPANKSASESAPQEEAPASEEAPAT